jgi:hypothetical protein
VRMRANDLGCPWESEATVSLHFVSLIEAMNMPVCSGLSGERPQPLGRRPCG